MVTGLKKRYDIGNQLKEIKQRALEVSDRRKRYKMDTSSAKSVVIDPRLPGLFQEAEKLVGINTQRDKIVKLLTSGTNLYQKKVLSIVGSGGLGKTTLAKQVFDKIKNQFQCTAFVYASQNYIVEKILTDVLLQFSESDSFFEQDQNEKTARMQKASHNRKLEYMQLVQITRDHLENKRYAMMLLRLTFC